MNYFGIEPVECNNGTGFGTTLFVAGCEHHCRECFNKKTWNRYGGEPFTEETLRYHDHRFRRVGDRSYDVRHCDSDE